MVLTVADVRTMLRVSTEVFDAEIEMHMESAKAEMLRVGIREDYVNGGLSLVNAAIVCYCKSKFGFDNPDAARYEELFRQHVIDLANSVANSAVVEEEPPSDEEEVPSEEEEVPSEEEGE